MAIKEVQVLPPQQITKKAQEVAISPLDKQVRILAEICAKSISDGVKVTIETLEIIKKNNEDINEGNKQFLALCDKGIDTLKASIADGEISEEMKKDVNNKIMDIMRMADGSNHKAMDNTKDGTNKATEVGKMVVVVSGVGIVAILGIIAAEIAKSLKK